MSIQGEKLNNIDQTLDNIDNNLYETQKAVNKLNHGIFGGLVNVFGPRQKKVEKKPEETKSKLNASSFESGGSKIDFVSITHSDPEREINNNLSELSKGLTNLGNMGKSLNVEIHRQNQQIESITQMADKSKTKILEQNKILKKL